MANELSILSDTLQIAKLAGLFQWDLSNGTYTNPNNKTITFSLINASNNIPLANYAGGLVSAYSSLFGTGDPNTKLFNTILSNGRIIENLTAKVSRKRIPFANFDQLVNVGIGGQEIVFTCVYAGAQYLTAFQQLCQVLFPTDNANVGTMNHPIYGQIKNVMPVQIGGVYQYDKLNCIVIDIIFWTSDITHLTTTPKVSIAQTAQLYALEALDALLSLQSAVNTVTSLVKSPTGALSL